MRFLGQGCIAVEEGDHLVRAGTRTYYCPHLTELPTTIQAINHSEAFEPTFNERRIILNPYRAKQNGKWIDVFAGQCPECKRAYVWVVPPKVEGERIINV